MDYFAALPGLASPLKRGLSQPRKTMIHTVGTNPEPKAGADTALESS
jgi:hypothetical protein